MKTAPTALLGMFVAGLKSGCRLPTADVTTYDLSVPRYLKAARKRLNAQLRDIKLEEEDVYAMQMMCAYEVSSFPSNSRSAHRPTNLLDCCSRVFQVL